VWIHFSRASREEATAKIADCANQSLTKRTGGKRRSGLFPAYAQNFLPSSVTSCHLKGDTPTTELVLGYKRSNESPILKLLSVDWMSAENAHLFSDLVRIRVVG
jgi:hypothetical protein